MLRVSGALRNVPGAGVLANAANVSASTPVCDKEDDAGTTKP